MRRLFVTGTGTDIGKTYVSSALLMAWRRSGTRAAGLKPIACGSREDAVILQRAGSCQLSIEEVNPLYLDEPLAPLVAAERAGIEIDPSTLVKQTREIARGAQVALIEGAGGWRVPITERYFMSDLARDLEAEVLLVASAALGTINHTLLTLEAIRNDGLPLRGIVVNHHDPTETEASRTNAGLLARLTGARLVTLGYDEEFDEPPNWLTAI